MFGAFLLLFIGLGSMLYNIQAAVSNFEFVLNFSSLIFVVIVPILTMRVIAEERKQNRPAALRPSHQHGSGHRGKYLALLILFLIPLAIISIYPLIFSQFGDVYLPTSYGSILAFFIMGAALIALGMFISSLTDNQGLAAGIGIAVILFNYYSVSLSEYVSSTAMGSVVALLVLILALAAIIRYLTKTRLWPTGSDWCWSLATLAMYLVNSTVFEGLLPEIMKALSLFDRFTTFCQRRI